MSKSKGNVRNANRSHLVCPDYWTREFARGECCTVGVLVQILFQTAAAGDSHAKESIRSYFFVDYGKIIADHSSGDPLRDSGEEQGKAVKL